MNFSIRILKLKSSRVVIAMSSSVPHHTAREKARDRGYCGAISIQRIVIPQATCICMPKNVGGEKTLAMLSRQKKHLALRMSIKVLRTLHDGSIMASFERKGKGKITSGL